MSKYIVDIHGEIEGDYEIVGKYEESTSKNDLVHNLCDSCTNTGCEFQSGIVRTECAFYMQPTVEAIPKDQYEQRLKADMVAMLTEIQLEIKELDGNHTIPDVWSNQASKEIWNTALKLIEEIIEVRINNLKGE